LRKRRQRRDARFADLCKILSPRDDRNDRRLTLTDEKEYGNIYAIPANYTDSGKLLGGMLEVRNAIETGFLLFLVGYPELVWLPNSSFKAVIMTVTLLPLGVSGLMGMSGDSLMQYTVRAALFLVRRRKLHFRRIGYRYDERKTAKKNGKRKKSKRNPCVHTGFHPDQRD
jgi:hypothetical protein